MGGVTALAFVALVLVVAFLSPFGLSNGFVPVDRHIRAVQLTLLPFSSNDVESDEAATTEIISDSLIRQLAGNSFIEVIIGPRGTYESFSDAQDVAPRSNGSRLVLAGIVRRGIAGMNAFVGLMNPADGRLVWSHDYDFTSSRERAITDGISESIVSDLQPPLVAAAKQKLAAMPEDALNAWELYLLASVSAGDKLSDLALEKHRMALAEKALSLEPNLGEAHAALASRLSTLVLVDPEPDTPEIREKLLFHARRAERLAPQNASVYYDIGIAYIRAGDREHGKDLLRRSSELDPSQVYSRIFSGMFDGICGAASQDMIDAVSREDAKLADNNPARWLTEGMLAMLYLSAGQPELAYQAQSTANQVGANPDTVFQFAAILNELGRTEDAAAWLDRWRVDWPALDPDHFPMSRCRECAATRPIRFRSARAICGLPKHFPNSDTLSRNARSRDARRRESP